MVNKQGATVVSLLTVLIPAYNEERGLAHAVEQVQAKLDDLDVEAEILIVDDCSTDRTSDIAGRLAAQYDSVRAVNHPVNRGIGGGMITGINQARGDWLILIPADLALDLNELYKYLDAASGADVIVGIRSDRSDYSLFRQLVSWTNIRLIQTLFGMKQRQFNYISMYRLDVLRELDIQYWHSAFFFAEIMIKARDLGRRLVEVDIHYIPRASGRATGAKVSLIARTVRDVFRFWVRWMWLRHMPLPHRRERERFS